MKNRLQELRLEKDWKQDYVAKKLRICISSLSKYENEKLLMKADVIMSFAELYDVSTDYLLGISSVRNTYKYKVKRITLSKEDTETLNKYMKLPDIDKRIVRDMIKELSE